MKIYISHARKFDYKNELYAPLKASPLASQHTLILPHERWDEPFATKELFREKGCELVIAEVSYSSTGQGIELGWADVMNIPIVCIYKQGVEIAGSLSRVSNKFLMYTDAENMISDITGLLKQYE